MEAVQHQKSNRARGGQYLTFVTAGEEYAIAILKVKEIIEYSTVTAVPNTPAWIRGVTNLRGNVVPVIDLAVKFALPLSRISKLSCIIITEVMAEGEILTLGVLADSVSQVLDLMNSDIEDPPPFGTRVRLEYLLGMGRMDNKKFCLILDIDKVLSADELLTVTESMDAGETADHSVASAAGRDQTHAAGSGV